ncbi:MAG: putative tRNA-dihydrouridine synthase [Planctomycetes bacterium ADurb.Bin126]|nr:MAG: putative tRNA-dihydrouridine synthase [Planctomycetes bacterium ADurb.Bin126]
MASELRPFSIGTVRVRFPVVLAPMAGYTDLAYRLICRQRGAEYCTSEMVLDRCALIHGKLRSRLLCLDPGDHPVGGQLIGNEPEVMAEAARAMEQIGFDVVDLNFACPVHKALSRRRGGHMMRESEQVLRIVRAVRAAVDCPVTLKVRRSFDEADHECEAFWRIAEGAFDAGADALTLHTRSVEAKYAGRADWELLARVKEHFADKTIIGSGDVLRPADALAMLEQTGVDAAAVARGCLGNPWFFRQAADLAAGREPYRASLAEQRELLLEHLDAACKLYGRLRGPRIMRKFGIKYARLHPHPKEVRMAFVDVKSPEDWRAVVEEHYPA